MTKKRTQTPLSPEEVSRLGEEFYFARLKSKLEKEHTGEYVVIDVRRKEYILHPDKLSAIEGARKRFGDQLFFIVQVGAIQSPVTNFKNTIYAWKF